MAQNDESVLARVLVSLYKGVVYKDNDELHWSRLLSRRADAAAHFSALGLEVHVDEAEGFAYLRTAQRDDEVDIPRLIPRRPLTYGVSLLLALLRKRMLEADRGQGELRLLLNREELVDLVRTFLPSGTNEARITDQVTAAVGKIEDLGFLRKLPGDREVWEVRRVLKSFIDAQWLADFEERLAGYRSVRTKGDSE